MTSFCHFKKIEKNARKRKSAKIIFSNDHNCRKIAPIFLVFDNTELKPNKKYVVTVWNMYDRGHYWYREVAAGGVLTAASRDQKIDCFSSTIIVITFHLVKRWSDYFFYFENWVSKKIYLLFEFRLTLSLELKKYIISIAGVNVP